MLFINAILFFIKVILVLFIKEANILNFSSIISIIIIKEFGKGNFLDLSKDSFPSLCFEYGFILHDPPECINHFMVIFWLKYLQISGK